MSNVGPPQGPPPSRPPHPASGRTGPPPTLPDPVRAGRTVLGGLLVLGAAVLAVLVLVFLHTSPSVEFTGSATDEDGLSTGEVVTSEIHCVSAAGGTSGIPDVDEIGDDVPEPNGVTAPDRDRGIEAGEANALCDQARSARISYAVESGFAALVLLVLGTAVFRRRHSASGQSSGPAASRS